MKIIVKQIFNRKSCKLLKIKLSLHRISQNQDFMRKIILATLLLACSLLSVMAQDNLSLTLKGVVYDRSTGKRLADAQVHVYQSTLATMTNADGRFSLKMDSIPQMLAISMLGYNTAILSREQLQNAQPKTPGGEVKEIKIQIEPTPKYLKEVYVYSPFNILCAAIDRINENFPKDPQSYDAFYRETISKRGKYVSVSEAVMQLYKTTYDKGDPDGDIVHLTKGRSLMSQRAKDTISVHVQGGPTESLYLDLVKNRGLFLNPETLNNYAFEFEAPQQIDGKTQCVIAFHPCVVVEEALFTGRIFIDYNTMTFTRIEYNIDMSDPQKVTNLILAKKPWGMRFTPQALEIVMNYHHDGRSSHLSYLKTTYRFKCDWKKRGIATRYEAISEMLITGYHKALTKPTRRGSFHNNDVLSKEVRDFSDPDFWKDYNILLPSESLEHAMKKIKKTYK